MILTNQEIQESASMKAKINSRMSSTLYEVKDINDSRDNKQFIAKIQSKSQKCNQIPLRVLNSEIKSKNCQNY
jgi:hypothetical protein